jgi:hypothetical protein
MKARGRLWSASRRRQVCAAAERSTLCRVRAAGNRRTRANCSNGQRQAGRDDGCT